MRSLARILVLAVVINASIPLAPASVAAAEQVRLPPRRSVEAILQTLQALDRPFGLAIIATTPPHPAPKNPYSIHELQAEITRSKKAIAFLDGISSVKTLEEVKAKVRSYLKKPSERSAGELETTLRLLIHQLDSDVRAPLWKKLVPPTNTASVQRLTRQLEQQTNLLRSTRGPVRR